jgi:hypothetical protein
LNLVGPDHCQKYSSSTTLVVVGSSFHIPHISLLAGTRQSHTHSPSTWTVEGTNDPHVQPDRSSVKANPKRPIPTNRLPPHEPSSQTTLEASPSRTPNWETAMAHLIPSANARCLRRTRTSCLLRWIPSMPNSSIRREWAGKRVSSGLTVKKSSLVIDNGIIGVTSLSWKKRVMGEWGSWLPVRTLFHLILLGRILMSPF